MRLRQAIKKQADFLTGLVLVLIGVEDKRNTQAGMHEGPEHQQGTNDRGHAELARLEHDEPMDVVLQADEDFGEEPALSTIELERPDAGFLAINDDVLQEIRKCGLEDSYFRRIPASQ